MKRNKNANYIDFFTNKKPDSVETCLSQSQTEPTLTEHREQIGDHIPETNSSVSADNENVVFAEEEIFEC